MTILSARRASLALPALILAFTLTPVRSPAAPDAGAMSAGDLAYRRGALGEARTLYLAAHEADPAGYGPLWRLARVESELGEDAGGEEQRRLVSGAVSRARAAVAAAPESAGGHVWLAVALGRQALKEGPRARLALAREIKSEADRALELDPGNARAHHVLGAWNRKIAGLSVIERMAANAVLGGVPKGASMDNAVSHFEKAIAIEPDYVNHRLELGRTLREMKRWADARRELEQAIALPPTSNPRDPAYQREARALLARLPKG